MYIYIYNSNACDLLKPQPSMEITIQADLKSNVY